MELTIVLSVSKGSEDYDILDTLESLPWDQDGVDLIIYSEDTKRIKEILKDPDLEPVVRDSKIGVVLCETQEDESQHHTIGFEDTKTERVMFLNSGDVIEDFQSDLLGLSSLDKVGFPGVGKEGLPETVSCHCVRTLPESYRGVVFNTDWLRKSGITNIDLTLMARVCSFLSEKLKKSDYWFGWSDYDISESLSVSLGDKDDNYKVIESLENLWSAHEIAYSPYLRDLIWTRIMTSAARIVTSGKEWDVSNFHTYLYPASKLTVLS